MRSNIFRPFRSAIATLATPRSRGNAHVRHIRQRQLSAGQSIFSNSIGRTQTEGHWIQDAWDFHQDWNFTVGGRLENWHAYDGNDTTTVGSRLQPVNPADRNTVNFSPRQAHLVPRGARQIGAAIGQAWRYPSASELFQTTTVGTGANAIVFNGNPTLKPEEALSSELSGEYFPDKAKLRPSFFQKRVKNAIFAGGD